MSSSGDFHETNKFSREHYRESHSRDIATIIYTQWTKEKIFASCEYKDGKINENIPNEPVVTNSGLARQHLVSGYEYVWNYYQQGVTESVRICNEIKSIIRAFEIRVLEDIDRGIETSHGVVKLERKTEDEFYIEEQGHLTVPIEFDFSLYLYPEILWEIFQAVANRNNKKNRRLWVKSLGTYYYLVIGNPDSRRYIQRELAFGEEEMMKELEKRVQGLIDSSQTQEFLVTYNLKKSELESNMSIGRYDEERNNIWKNVDVEGQFIAGECSKCSEDYLNSIFYIPSYEAYTHVGDIIVKGDVFSDLQNATIINKALVENSFNKVRREHDEETSKALVGVAKFIEKSGDPASGALFDKFNEELNKPQPDKFRLKSFWTSIQNNLPAIASIAGSVAKVVALFA